MEHVLTQPRLRRTLFYPYPRTVDLSLCMQAEMAKRIPGFGGKFSVKKRVSRRSVK